MTTVVVTDQRPTVVVVNTPSPTRVVSSPNNTDILQTPTYVAEVQTNTTTASVTIPGPQGPPGDTDAAMLIGTAATAINALKVVKFEADLLYIASATLQTDANKVVGIAVTAASNPGDTISVRTDGEMSDGSWNWASGAVYLGANGVLTQTAPLTGFVLEIGRVRAPTKIIIDIQNPFMRA